MGRAVDLPFRAERRMGAIRERLVLLVLFSTAWLIWWFGWSGSSVSQSENPTGEGERNLWKWSLITPKRHLEWHRCFEKFDCARLDVPLDWLDPSDELRASIAVIRYNATDRDNYKGPVFINPGGPGGSGIYFAKHLAPYYQSVVGKNHDIISFDPRGIGASTPKINCFSSEQNARIWGLGEINVLDAHPGVIYDSYAHASAFSQHCASLIGGGSSSQLAVLSPAERKVQEAGPGRFVTTASVSRDMLAIGEVLGLEKIRYWGFSYGTFLGTTFASMFPDRIDRMVNDGNVDPGEYVSGAATHFIHDTDKVMNSFYQYCHSAGPERCPFYAESPSAIESRLDKLLEELRRHPIIVPAASLEGRPDVVTFSHVRRMIASALYRPLVIFPQLARALVRLEGGDGLLFIELSGQGSGDPFQCESEGGPSPELPEVEGDEDASKAILCTDAEPVNATVEEFGAHVDKLTTISKSAGATMANMLLGCVGWKVKAKWRFTGPWGGNTSFPILFIANIADNVTPLRSAVLNSRNFKGSVVLIQNSYGHTTLSSPSRCTAKAIRAYFQEGTLPMRDTICEPDFVPFDNWEERNITTESDADDFGGQVDNALVKLMNAPVLRF